MDVRRHAVVALTLPVLVLSACTDEGSSQEPSPTPSSSSPTPTVTPTDTGPSIPPEALGDDEESAKAFVKYYFEVVSEGIVTGDMSTLEQLSHAKCESCNALSERVVNVYDKGGALKTEGWIVEALVRDPTDNPRHKAFFARVRQDRQALFDAEGRQVDVIKRKLQGMHLIVEQRESGWVMLRMGLLG